jgi:hypothetical protein
MASGNGDDDEDVTAETPASLMRLMLSPDEPTTKIPAGRVMELIAEVTGIDPARIVPPPARRVPKQDTAPSDPTAAAPPLATDVHRMSDALIEIVESAPDATRAPDPVDDGWEVILDEDGNAVQDPASDLESYLRERLRGV